jgi:hypothetical protein
VISVADYSHSSVLTPLSVCLTLPAAISEGIHPSIHSRWTRDATNFDATTPMRSRRIRFFLSISLSAVRLKPDAWLTDDGYSLSFFKNLPRKRIERVYRNDCSIRLRHSWTVAFRFRPAPGSSSRWPTVLALSDTPGRSPPVSWGGLRWFSLPLYMLAGKTADERQQVLLHGLFHRIQSDLGFLTDKGYNDHLDTLEGRVWMQLEWRALRRALESSGSDRAEAIADALAFRRARRRLFPGAADNERCDEIAAFLLYRSRGLGQFAGGCPPCRSASCEC